MPEFPRKDFYKLSEVCQYTDTQPYVLRFWESEFPQLDPRRSAGGARMYRKRDIDVVHRIKELLYEEEHTLDVAREKLAEEMSRGKAPRPARKTVATTKETADVEEADVAARKQQRPVTKKPVSRSSSLPAEVMEMISRERYENAIDEIEHLRLALKDAEKATPRAEADAEEAQVVAEREEQRAARAIDYLERLQEILS